MTQAASAAGARPGRSQGASDDAAGHGASRALGGLTVLQIAGGAAGGYCGRLLVDAGATVRLVALTPQEADAGVVRADLALERAYARYLDAGKERLPPAPDAAALARMCAEADLVLVGEASSFDPALAQPRIATIDLQWFGREGPYRHWQGADLLIQGLSGAAHLTGSPDGPPLAAGDRQATALGGVLAYIASCAAILAADRGRHAPGRLYEVSILEANVLVSEMHLHMFERDGVASRRWGVNAFHPNAPIGIYPCRQGQVGITVATPDQWRALCAVLALEDLLADPSLMTLELRFARRTEVEARVVRALAARTADEWAAIGREHRIPMVVVPDAAQILDHPVFAARGALVDFPHAGATLRVPRSPLPSGGRPLQRPAGGLAPGASLAGGGAASALAGTPVETGAVPPGDRVLEGLAIVDFSMGWAGPMATRLLADLGATVVKVEAGRYPDWWRGMTWSAEIIAQQMHEKAKPFTALNRGKLGVSLDLTVPEGRRLALELVRGADAVIENQAAGVMDKLGLGYSRLAGVNPDLVMVSMSAFGGGNVWSGTRAYGSTLEQASGLPAFAGHPGTAPTMAHLAYGDPVGGLYGCAALLTALVQRQRGGGGQFVNASLVEAMLQLATPGLLEHQLSATGAVRRGNAHAAMAPHGAYPAAGDDQWVTVAVTDAQAFGRLAALLGRPDWACDGELQSLEGRRRRDGELGAAIAAWTRRISAAEAAARLQQAGIAAAPMLRVEELQRDAQLVAADFFCVVPRAMSGPQVQMGPPIKPGGRRIRPQRPAPLLGEHTRAVLRTHAGVDDAAYHQLVQQAVVSCVPTPVRNLQ